MSADLILTNAKVYTVDPNQPEASAIAMRDGKFIAVGDEASVMVHKSEATEVVDLGGRAVTPGLVDAHVHFYWFALTFQQIDLDFADSFAEICQRIKDGAAAKPDIPWLLGRGWNHTTWSDTDGDFPNRAQLDAVESERPAHFRAKSGHASWANSKALEIAGISAETPDPEGGEIVRDENGEPTGILLETAIQLVVAHEPDPTEAEVVDAMHEAQEYCWKAGITGLHDFDGVECFKALQTLERKGELGIRFVKNIPAAHVAAASEAGLRSGFGSDWLRMGGVKIFADGALGQRTALMIEPYETEPDNRGMVVVDKEEMMRIAVLSAENQLHITVHAIGDRAVHDVIDVIEEAKKVEDPNFPPLRHRIEHVQIIHPEDQPRMAELGIIASMQPIHATSDMLMAMPLIGSRTKDAYAQRTMLDSGATVVLGSDSPVEPIDPLFGIHAAVTRQRADNSPEGGWHPEQKFSVAEAVHGFTQAAAYTCGQEDRQGSVTVGKLADLTIYEQNIYEIDPTELHSVKVAGTIVGGEFKYRNL